MLNGMPSIWLPIVLIVKWSRLPGSTENVLLVPDLPAPVVLMVIPVPAVINVTGPVHTPSVKEPVVVGLMVPGAVNVFCPV